MNEIQLLNLTIKDFFSKEILKVAISPFVVTLVILYGIFIYGANLGFDTVGENSIQIHQEKTEVIDGIPHTTTTNEEYQGSSIVQFLFSNSITSGVIEFIVYTLGTLFTIILSVFVAVAVIGFFTPYVLNKIREKHYPDLPKNSYGNLFSGIWVLVGSFLTMLFLLVLFIPLYFVPLVNVVAFNLPFYYFFHKILDFDVSSSILTKDDYARIKITDRNKIRFRTLLLYVASLFPFVGIVFPIFFVIYLGHGYFAKLKEIH